MSDNEDIYFEKPKLERQVATSFDLSPPKLNIPEPPKGAKHFWNNFESPVKESNRFKVNLVTDSQISNWYNSLNFYEKKNGYNTLYLTCQKMTLIFKLIIMNLKENRLNHHLKS